MSFESPYHLLLLLAVPVTVWGLVRLERRRVARSSLWAPRALQANMVARPPAWRSRLPLALVLLGASILVVGFARPQATVSVSTQEATVVLVLDVSGSMAANDELPSRLVAAKLAAARFVSELPHGYRMAVIVFSDHSAVVAAPTTNLTRVRAAISAAKTGVQGTALADAVERAVHLGRSVRGAPGSSRARPPAVVVVFSDGGQTAGRTTPQQAWQAAKLAGIPVTTVAIGGADGVVTQALAGGFKEQIQVPAQPAVLQAIASGSGGTFFPSPASVDVRRVYAQLGSRVGSRRKTIEVTAAAAGGGLAFMLAGALLSGLWLRRLP
jgi:Ca-activated chloride channel family protein